MKSFVITIPTDNGFVGRACDASECKQYFKVLTADLKEHMYCPYCGESFSKSQMLTKEHLAYARQAAVEEARVYAVAEVQKMLKSALRGARNITYKPGPKPRKRTLRSRYTERQVDTELRCPNCNTSFQVYGIFGYCPGCRFENLQIYDANWSMIERQIDEATDKNRQIRHAYGDLVSTFEDFCKRKAARLTAETANFQVLKDARKYFKDHAGVDILDGLSNPELLSLRRLFQKRHVCVHAGGKITEKYIQRIPEDNKLNIGEPVQLSKQELVEAASAMRTALGVLVQQIERPGK